MGQFSPGGGIVSATVDPSGPIDVTGTGLVKNSPVILNIAIPSALVEVPIAVPSCASFLIRSRLSAKMYVSYIMGDTSTVYLTIHSGVVYNEDNLVPTARTLYLQSTKNGDTVELLYWTA